MNKKGTRNKVETKFNRNQNKIEIKPKQSLLIKIKSRIIQNEVKMNLK